MRIMRGLWIGLLMLLVGCTTVSMSGAQTVDVTSDVGAIEQRSAPALGPNVSVDEVLALVEAGGVAVIDVRDAVAFAEGHIAGATLLSLGELPDRVSEVPTDQPVVLVCRSGNRSSQAYSYLENQGFMNIHNMTGGMLAWQKAGYAVEK